MMTGIELPLGRGVVATVRAALTAVPISWYGIVIGSYLCLKFAGTLRYEPVTDDLVARDDAEALPDGGNVPSVSVIVPEYNESPELIEQCLDSILAQSYDVADIFVTDDGSDDTAAWEVIQRYAAEHDPIDAARLEENMGKRHAQARGFREATGDLYVTVDSDTVLEPDAIEQIVKPFADEEVTAVTGYPEVINRDANVLTQLIHMRYWTAFNVDRAARSLRGLVLCCCGVFSAYRASVVDENLDAYTSQTFLGAECTFGDDRRLTMYALRAGDVCYQRTAVAATSAPETVRTYVRQQIRWMRSFWRESLLWLRWSPREDLVLTGMLLAELALPILLLTFGLGHALRQSLFTSATLAIVAYVLVISFMAYVRNVFFANVETKTYLLSPVYGLVYVLLLLPMTFYALATMRANHWGTR